MKYIPLILLMINVNICFGQGVRFQVRLTKACSNVEKIDSSYYVESMGSLPEEFTPKNGIVNLPNPGTYRIGFAYGPILDSALVMIKDTGLYVFRYRESKIQLYETGAIDTPPIYVVCGTPANGYAEDFYTNGNIKVRGNFKNGYRKDSLITFYPNGKVNKRIINLPKEIYIENFDSLGNKLKITYNQKGSFMTYNGHRSTAFFPNGKIRLKESDYERILRIEEYYPNGQLKVKQNKTTRTEYYENGIKRMTYSWENKKDRITKSKDFTIHKTEYGENGLILQATVYEVWNKSDPQPDLDFSKSDYLKSMIKYKAGKEISVVKGD